MGTWKLNILINGQAVQQHAYSRENNDELGLSIKILEL